MVEGQAPIHVTASTLGGVTAEIDTVESCLVGDLKQTLEESLNIPALCQKLLLDTQILEDNRCLSQYGSGHLSMSVLVSTQRLIEQLRHSTSHDKNGDAITSGLHAISTLGLVDEETMEVIGGILHQPRRHRLILKLAIDTLLSLVGRDSELAFSAFDGYCLCADDQGTRALAISQVGGMQGNATLRTGLCVSLCTAPTAPTRARAKKKGRGRQQRLKGWQIAARLQALGRIAEQGDSEVLQALLNLLRNETRALVKLTACDTLCHMLRGPGADEALLAVVRSFFYEVLEREEKNERRGTCALWKDRPQAWTAFVQLLTEFGERDNDAMVAACEHLLHARKASRSDRAAQVFAAVATSANTQVISTLISHVQTGVLSHQRSAAAAALGGIAATDDATVVAALVAALKDSPDVAQAAVTALGKVGSSAALEAVLECRTHTDGWVRRMLPQALVRLAAYGEEAAITAVVQCAKTGYDDEAVAALVALRAFGPSGINSALAAAEECVGERDREVRQAAIATLAYVGQTASHSAAAAAALKLGASPKSWLDLDEDVTRDAIQALQELSSGGCSEATAVLEDFADSGMAHVEAQSKAALKLAATVSAEGASAPSQGSKPVNWTKLLEELSDTEEE